MSETEENKTENNVKWKVFIKGHGFVEIMGTEDIDSSYENAVKKYNCTIDEIWAVISNQKVNID